MYAQDSIDMLIRSGIDFTKHEEHGIDVTHFGELLMTSGTNFGGKGTPNMFHLFRASLSARGQMDLLP